MKEKVSLKNELSQFTELSEKYGYDNFNDFDVFVSSLSSDVVTSTRMLQCLTTEKEQLDSKCLELESWLKNSQNGCSNTDLELLREAMAQKDCTILEKNSEIDEKNDIITEKLHQIEQLEENIRQFENEPLSGNHVNENTTDSQREEVISLNQTIEMLQKEIKELKITEEKHTSEIQEKHMLIGELRSQLVDVRESSSVESESREKSGSVELLREKLAEKDEMVFQLAQDLKGAQMFGENLKIELEENSEKVKEMTLKWEQAEENYKHLQGMQFLSNYARG